MNKNTLFNRVFGEVHYVDKLISICEINNRIVYRVYPVDTMKIYTRQSYDMKDIKTILKTPCMADDITFESNTFYCTDKNIVFEDDLYKSSFITDIYFIYNKLMKRFYTLYNKDIDLINFKNLIRKYNFLITNSFLHFDMEIYTEVKSIITNENYKYSKED